jgi:hypothetical protein
MCFFAVVDDAESVAKRFGDFRTIAARKYESIEVGGQLRMEPMFVQAFDLLREDAAE